VKRALEKVFPKMREWYISHLTHLALADANLRTAMLQRFYNRYHHKAAYKQKLTRAAQKKEFLFSYLLDMQAMFHPELSNGQLLYRINFSFDNVTREDKERHYNALKGYLWETVTGLVDGVAFHRLSTDDIPEDYLNSLQQKRSALKILT
jgi:hypothetical protein